MKFITLSLFLSFFHFCSTHPATQLPHIVEENDQKAALFSNGVFCLPNLCLGKIKDTSHHDALWAVMERVTPHNLPLWKNYAEGQSNALRHEKVKPILDKMKLASLGDGTYFFHRVIEEVDIERNEVWIAYIREGNLDDASSGIPLAMKDYWEGNATNPVYPDPQNNFARKIKMFMTVVSSSHAFLTSHMGVAFSIESILLNEILRGYANDLHSFAAKIMLMKNPKRIYMVHAPTPKVAQSLEGILSPTPDAFFAGTVNMRPENYIPEDPIFQRLVRSHPSILWVDQVNTIQHHFKILSPDGSSLVDATEHSSDYDWMFSDAFKPLGLTEYIEISLPALASLKQLKPLSQEESRYLLS